MDNFEIKTRIRKQDDGSGKLKLTVKNGWSFWHYFTVENNTEIRGYLKSEEFKEYAYSLFNKYKDMSYKQICDNRLMRNDDFKKIGEKLEKFAFSPSEEPFRIIMKVNLIKTYSNGYRYKVVFSNNKNNSKIWWKRTQYGMFDRCEVDWDLEHKWNQLVYNKELMNKLKTYKTWKEFNDDVYTNNDLINLIDNIIIEKKAKAA